MAAGPVPAVSLLGALPTRLAPMLAVPRPEAFDSTDHIFEVWWEGIRVSASIEGGSVVLRSRSQQDVTPYFPEVAKALRKRVRGDGIVLDGILTAPDGKGVPRVAGILRRTHGRDEESRSVVVAFQLFDLLYRDFRPLLRYPLLRRKHALKECVDPDETVQLGHYEEGTGLAFFEAATRLGLPGMVAKEKTSLYTPGRRNSAWVQVLANREANVVIGGYTLGDPARKEPFGNLLLGAYDAEGLRYLGSVAGGFHQDDGAIMGSLLHERQSDECPFVDPPRMGKLLYWCEPSLVARIGYGEVSASGQLQFAVYKGLRPDLEARDCAIERLQP